MSEKEDIEMSFIRMLSVHGLVLCGNVSSADRRERIRRAIVEQRLKDRPYDATISYGEAYRRCYLNGLAMPRIAIDGIKLTEEPDPVN